MIPVTLACGPAKSTQRIFEEWLKMIASYVVLLVATAGFMRVGTFVIYQSFHYAGSTNLISNIFSFMVAIMFLTIIYDLEKYVEKLGLNAVGLPDSVSGISREIGGLANNLKYSLTREGVRSALNAAKGIPSNPDFQVKTPDHIPDRSLNEAFGQGINEKDDDGNEINPLASFMMDRNDNDNAFVTDSNGDYVRGSDGLMHHEDEFEEDENGNVVLRDNPSVTPEDETMKERYSIADADAGIASEGIRGLDESTGAFTKVKDAPERTSAVADQNGNYFMSQSDDGMIAVNRDDLDSSNMANYALKTDNEGNFRAVEWNSDSDGDKFRLDRDGNLVNIGNGVSYSLAATGTDGAVEVRYMTDRKGKKVVNAKSNRVEDRVQYNTNLPKNAKISSMNNLEYCSTLYSAKDGTRTGIARQRLVDEKTGRPTGQSRYVKFTLYENNEINRDEISRHSRTAKGNPCEGYTPSGKQYIHIDKYMGERKRKTIQKYRG